jgi:hypothetical protein
MTPNNTIPRTGCKRHFTGLFSPPRAPGARKTRAAGDARRFTLLEDHRQKGLFPTTIGGGVTVKSSDKWRVTLRQAQGRLSDEQGAAKANL